VDEAGLTAGATMSGEGDRRGVLSGGNWIIDHVKLIDRFPEQDTLSNITGQSRGTGGAPYNVLVDLAKLGAPFPLEGVGLVGDDEDGHAILGDCREFGIDAAQLRVTRDAVTSYTDVMTVQSTGRRTFFHARGANALLSEQHFDLSASRARLFHFGYLLLLDRMDQPAPDGSTGASRLLRRARELGFKTSVDMVSVDRSRFRSVVLPSLPHTDFLIVNEFEAASSTGIEVSRDGAVDFARVSQAAGRLFELGVQEWVIVHAPEGALARHRDGAEHVQGSVRLPAESIAGTAGAGDAFAAGAILGLHESLPMDETLRLAACAAASSLSHPTCTAGVKSTAECLRLGELHGFRGIAR
jgi:sugar/nucleoside kinase (ribokinase family)